jgi:hypothetical protein
VDGNIRKMPHPILSKGEGYLITTYHTNAEIQSDSN